jgi:hypothetical protein
MSFMNNAIRQQGNRARALPNIGQNPTQPPQSVPGLTPPPNSVSGPPPPVNPLGTTGPMGCSRSDSARRKSLQPAPPRTSSGPDPLQLRAAE